MFKRVTLVNRLRGQVIALALLLGCVERPIVEELPARTNTQAEARVVSDSLDATKPDLAFDKPREFYRVELSRLSRQGEQVKLVSIDRVSLASQPVPALCAEYALLSNARGTAITGVPVCFPVNAQSTSIDAQGRVTGHEDIALEESRVAAFIEAAGGADELVLFDRGGVRQLRIGANELPSAAGSGGGSGNGDKLRARFPQIRFLRRGAESEVPREVLMEGTLLDELPDFYAITLEDALAHLEPPVRNAITTIAVVDYPLLPVSEENGAPPLSYNCGPLLVLSAALSDLMLRHLLAHEAAHALWFAISQATRTGIAHPLVLFNPEILAAVKPIIERFRLSHGIAAVWEGLQASADLENKPVAYLGKSWMKLEASEAPRMGFFSPYGSSESREDFAEYVGDRAGASILGNEPCLAFQNSTGVDTYFATAYAKLVFLTGIGAISKSSFEECIGDYSVLPKKPAIDFLGRGVITKNLRARYSNEVPDGPTYRVSGVLDPFRFFINIRLPDEKSSAIGLHRLDSIAGLNANSAANHSHVAVLGTSDRTTLASQSGLVLITEALEGRAQGVIFGLALQDEEGRVESIYRCASFRVE